MGRIWVLHHCAVPWPWWGHVCMMHVQSCIIQASNCMLLLPLNVVLSHLVAHGIPPPGLQRVVDLMHCFYAGKGPRVYA